MTKKIVFSFLTSLLLVSSTAFAQSFSITPASIFLSLYNCQFQQVTLTVSNNEIDEWLQFTVSYDDQQVALSDGIPPMGIFEPTVTISASPSGTNKISLAKEIIITGTVVGDSSLVSKSIYVTIYSEPSLQEQQASGNLADAALSISSAQSAIDAAKKTMNDAQYLNLDVTQANVYLEDAQDEMIRSDSSYEDAQNVFSDCRNDLSNFDAVADSARQSADAADLAKQDADTAYNLAMNAINAQVPKKPTVTGGLISPINISSTYFLILGLALAGAAVAFFYIKGYKR